MSASPAPSAAKANRAIGAMFFSGFGTLWLVVGDIVARGGPDWTLATVVVAGACLAAIAWRRFQANRVARAALEDTPRAKRIARVFNWVNAGQWVLIFVLANVLRNLGLDTWVMPMIMAVVGLHLLPLAAVMGYRPHYVSGVALVLVAALFPFVASDGPQSAAGPFGAGLILWASAIFGLTVGGREADPTTTGNEIAG